MPYAVWCSQKFYFKKEQSEMQEENQINDHGVSGRVFHGEWSSQMLVTEDIKESSFR